MNKPIISRTSADIYVSPAIDIVIIESNCTSLIESGAYGEYGSAGNQGSEIDYGTL